MKVLYDHQAFMWTKYSGIPRYFCELIKSYLNDSDMEILMPYGYCQNLDYRNIISKNKIPTSWKFKDSIVGMSKNIIHKDPTAYITNIESKSRSMIKSSEYDVFHPTHFSQYFLQDFSKIKAPFVITVHDLTIEKYPEYFPFAKTANMIKNTCALLSNASRIISISEYTKNDLIKYYDVDPSIIDVVYHGPPLMHYHNKGDVDKTKEHKNMNQYILFVGERGAHKNFYIVVEALKDLLINDNFKLVCAGSPFSQPEIDFINSMSIDNKIIQVSPNNLELINYYMNATLFIYPSINEGFGFTILEAFSCGCPVVCSNASCFPEVAGDAALYFDPKDVVSICETVNRVISDDKLRDKMREMGYKQLNKFSWDKCAKETKNVYNKLIS